MGMKLLINAINFGFNFNKNIYFITKLLLLITQNNLFINKCKNWNILVINLK